MPATVLDSDRDTQLGEEIRRLKRERGAIILAHNYQIPPIQDLADFVGDSLGLSRAAAKTEAPLIVFCGVHFMAETAAIINPDKTVLIPDLGAGCSLVDSSPTLEQIRAWRQRHPNGVVVSYVNTTAAVKAESDYCCTSSNAVQVVNSVPAGRDILFLPDMFLGAYVEAKTGRKIDIWHGECHVHAGIRAEDIIQMRERYADAEFLVHPECSCASQTMYMLAKNDIPNHGAYITSTEGMVRRAKESAASTFIVATETGILHRLRKEVDGGKRFVPVREDAVCQYMKMITLEKLYRSLRDLVYRVEVPPDVAQRARLAIQRMLEIG